MKESTAEESAACSVGTMLVLFCLSMPLESFAVFALSAHQHAASTGINALL
jgi:hypothetical protein